MKQTAVEWLFEQVWITSGEDLPELLEQAKEMEKQQIMEAFKRGTINEMNGIEEITSEQHYNETFNK